MVTVAFALLGWQEWIASKSADDEYEVLAGVEDEDAVGRDRDTGLGLWDGRDGRS
jgi:hypothetical protein